jgi:hypothetical protein
MTFGKSADYGDVEYREKNKADGGFIKAKSCSRLSTL